MADPTIIPLGERFQDELADLLERLYQEGTLQRLLAESENLFMLRVGEARGGSGWQNSLGSTAESVYHILMGSIDLDKKIRRYTSENMRCLMELSDSLTDPNDRLSQDLPALAELQAISDGLESNVQRLKKILFELPAQCDRMQKLIFRLNPPTFAAFCQKYNPLISRLLAETSCSEDVCIICSTNKVNIQLTRQCNRCAVDSPLACQCKPMICLDCLLNIYWTQSEQEQRSYAPCPLCRSHFCLSDFQPLTPETAKRPVEKGKKSRSKRVKRQS
jgi:hypothetical protein